MTALAEIQDRVRNSMCLTWGADQGERMEARISEADWNEVVKVLEFYAKHEHWISIGEDGPQTVLVAHGDVQGVEMTETELKPCPFCGYALSYDEGICPAKEVEDDEDETDVGIGGICCPSCAVWLPLDKPTPAEAIAAWNRRTALTLPAKPE